MTPQLKSTCSSQHSRDMHGMTSPQEPHANHGEDKKHWRLYKVLEIELQGLFCFQKRHLGPRWRGIPASWRAGHPLGLAKEPKQPELRKADGDLKAERGRGAFRNAAHRKLRVIEGLACRAPTEHSLACALKRRTTRRSESVAAYRTCFGTKLTKSDKCMHARLT